ncbi:hypothetical protein [Paracoccus jiaweipingae]|uniref:hypothetical protein n=1 Tax=unclassified Paracoccus (in: a-proteobacteria) TaxID=2688777 RepID=UPI0037AA9E91
MKRLQDYADERHKGWCIHCKAVLGSVESNLDHVPSKTILDRPFPDDLPTVRICKSCNASFANDEEYFTAFLGSVLAGSTDPEQQIVARSAKILSSNYRLQDEIESQLQIVKNSDGNDQISFIPDMARIQNVVVKNARGHVLFEHGHPVDGEPARVAILPIPSLSPDALSNFERIDYGAGWPEVGSRLMQRLVSGEDMRPDGWVVVQPRVYRFAVMNHGQFVVRTVIREYLATEVVWDDI